MVALAIAFALSGFTLPTNAFAAGNTFSVKAAHRSHHILDGRDYDRPAWGGRRYEWDPWHHWGAYYGPSSPVL
jgi:hypothetical protein